jgi:hypothetical protein
LHNGDRPTGPEIARHLESVCGALPAQVETIFARADSGFYCGDAVVAYQARGVQFIISARKTGRLVEELKAAEWKRTDVDGQCEFQYQPEDWDKAYRFIALRYKKKPKPVAVFVTNMQRAIDLLVWFYDQRAGAENDRGAGRVAGNKPEPYAGSAHG